MGLRDSERAYVVEGEGDVVLFLGTVLPPFGMEENVVDVGPDVDACVGPLHALRRGS